MIDFLFATGNQHKIDEANAALEKYGIRVTKLEGRQKIEIQHPNLEEIAQAALALLIRGTKGIVVVEDSGLFVHALNGFPGPYSAYVFETLGTDGLIKLLEGCPNRKAEFRSSVSAGIDGEPLGTFSSVTEGIIVMNSRGRNGFGFDPVFVPMWTQKTFAEMTTREKTVYSHRSKAFTKLALWYMNESKKQ